MLGITNTEFLGRNWGNIAFWVIRSSVLGVNRAQAREGRSPYFKNAR